MYNTIQLDGVEYFLVPQYKINSWVVYTENNEMRRVIADVAYKNRAEVNKIFGSYMTIGAAHQFYKDIRPAATTEIYDHLNKMRISKELIGKSTLSFNGKEFECPIDPIIGYRTEDDTLWISTRHEVEAILYQNGVWATRVEKKEFFFGGRKVEFFPTTDGKDVNIKCEGYVDNLETLQKVVDNPTKEWLIGSHKVKGYTLKGDLDVKKTIPTVPATGWLNYYATHIDEVIIGCTVGKYKELVDIYNYAKSLIK